MINNISLNISKNGMYGLVGDNGSGKTTILGLIDNIYDCDSGEILINSIPINNFSPEEIRDKITYVSREPLVLPGDIWHNLKLGNTDISEEKIIDACKKTGIHQDIMGFESQYDTPLEVISKEL
ncbi:ATP-binding cassette domain-containing protein [Mogibacterium diversum]